MFLDCTHLWQLNATCLMIKENIIKKYFIMFSKMEATLLVFGISYNFKGSIPTQL